MGAEPHPTRITSLNSLVALKLSHHFETKIKTLNPVTAHKTILYAVLTNFSRNSSFTWCRQLFHVFAKLLTKTSFMLPLQRCSFGEANKSDSDVKKVHVNNYCSDKTEHNAIHKHQHQQQHLWGVSGQDEGASETFRGRTLWVHYFCMSFLLRKWT